MGQIIWLEPSGSIALTALGEATSAEAEAERLQELGHVPGDWEPVQLRADGDHLQIEDWLFFGAYSADTSHAWVDMPRARDIWRDQIRAAREELFTPLDVAAQRAIEEGHAEKLAEIARGADVLVHEVINEAGLSKLPEFWQRYHGSSHTTTSELARLASAAQPKLLVLTHILHYGAPIESTLTEVQQGYDGKVVLANDLDVF